MYYISFSFDGIRRETYEHIRRRARYDEVIASISAVRETFHGRSTLFNLNYTIMRRNLVELAEATDFWDARGFDAMNFIFMVVRELEPELIKESLYPVRRRAFRLLDDLAMHVIDARRRLTVRCPYYRTSPLRSTHPAHFDDVVVRSAHPSARLVPIPRNDIQLEPFPGMAFPCGRRSRRRASWPMATSSCVTSSWSAISTKAASGHLVRRARRSGSPAAHGARQDLPGM